MQNQNRKPLAVVTGGSSGLGRDMASALVRKGYDVIIAARSEKRLNEVKNMLDGNAHIFVCDLSNKNDCLALYEESKKLGGAEVLINNAGFGLFGEFNNSELDTELSMIDTNIRALHTLTKLYLKDFYKNDRGYILNVSSSAAFMPGPLMSTYYSTKAYVLRLTQAIYRELKHQKSNVYIGALCPGPVDTNFNNTANVTFALKGLKSADVAEYAIKKMFKRKAVIIPGLSMKLGKFALRLIPDKLAAAVSYNIQKRKG